MVDPSTSILVDALADDLYPAVMPFHALRVGEQVEEKDEATFHLEAGYVRWA